MKINRTVDPEAWPEIAMGPKTLDITGASYGELSVIRLVGYKHTEKLYRSSGSAFGDYRFILKTAVWLCSCSCGRHCLVRVSPLRGGLVKDCGACHPKTQSERSETAETPHV